MYLLLLCFVYSQLLLLRLWMAYCLCFYLQAGVCMTPQVGREIMHEPHEYMFLPCTKRASKIAITLLTGLIQVDWFVGSTFWSVYYRKLESVEIMESQKLEGDHSCKTGVYPLDN